MEQTIGALLAALADVAARLEALDASDRPWLQEATAGGRPGDRARFEELVHVATHELGSQLGFLVGDLGALARRIALRQRCARELNDEQFELAIASPWSLELVRTIARARGLHSAEEQHALAGRLRQLQAEWQECQTHTEN